jgi:hypothetical protein
MLVRSRGTIQGFITRTFYPLSRSGDAVFPDGEKTKTPLAVERLKGASTQPLVRLWLSMNTFEEMFVAFGVCGPAPRGQCTRSDWCDDKISSLGNLAIGAGVCGATRRGRVLGTGWNLERSEALMLECHDPRYPSKCHGETPRKAPLHFQEAQKSSACEECDISPALPKPQVLF